MKTKIFCTLLCAILFTMCTDENNLTYTLKMDGRLTVNVKDSSDNSIKNTKVNLYVESINGSLLDAYYTNNKGVVDFGEVLAGTYVVTVDTPAIDGIKYNPLKLFQVTSGSDKNLIINIQDYIGKVKVTINLSSYLGGGPFINLDVILVPNDLYNANLSVLDLISISEFSGKTDSQGIINFSIPSRRDFRLIVYNNRKDRKNALTLVNLSKDEFKKLTYSVDTSMYIY